jgi:hypothetical protein
MNGCALRLTQMRQSQKRGEAVDADLNSMPGHPASAQASRPPSLSKLIMASR